MQVPDLSHVSFELLEVYPAGISEGGTVVDLAYVSFGGLAQ